MLPSILPTATSSLAATMLRLLNVNNGLLSLVKDNDVSPAAVERSNAVLDVLVAQLAADIGPDSMLGCELKALFADASASDVDELHVNVLALNGWITGVFASFALADPTGVPAGQMSVEQVAVPQPAVCLDDPLSHRPGIYL